MRWICEEGYKCVMKWRNEREFLMKGRKINGFER